VDTSLGGEGVEVMEKKIRMLREKGGERGKIRWGGRMVDGVKKNMCSSWGGMVEDVLEQGVVLKGGVEGGMEVGEGQRERSGGGE